MPTSDPDARISIRSGHSARWLLLASVLFLLQVLPFLSYRWVTDESWYAGPGYAIAHGQGVRDPEIGPNDLENRFDTRPPGTALVIATAFRTVGEGPWEARLGSVVAGLLVLVLTWRITQPWLGSEGAAVATLVVATDNLLVAASRTARPEALSTMGMMFAMWAMGRYVASENSRRLHWAFASGLLIAAAAMFHITVAGFAVALGLLAIGVDYKRKGRSLPGAIPGAAMYVLGFLLGLVPFATWVLTSPLGPASFRAEYLGRAGHDLTPVQRLGHELHRYSDVFGLNMLHGHGLENLPVRLPIPLLFFFASWLLWRYARRWFYVELVLLIPTLCWFVETVNKSSRYLALVAPLLAMVFGAAVTATRDQPRWRRTALAVAGFVIAAQFGANLVLLRGASKADYNRTGALLAAAIPPGEAAYGTITFWLALRDHRFLSQERTTPQMAAEDFGVHYFILGDRMMAEGSAWDAAYFASMRQSLADIEARGTLVREVPDPYYGDLRVYRIP